MQLNRNTLKAVEKAMSADATRYNLHGMRLEPGRVLATDGHRLHVVEMDSTLAGLEAATVERSAVKRLASDLGKDAEAVVDVGESNANGAVVVELQREGSRFRGEYPKVPDADFPNADQVIPKHEPTPKPTDTDKHIAYFNAKYLKEMCEAVIALSDDRQPAMRIQLNGPFCAARVDAVGAGETAFLGVLMPMRGE